MKHFVLFAAAAALLVGCGQENSDSSNRITSHPGYTMNEPAGGSTSTNKGNGSTFSGSQGGSASSGAGLEQSGSSSPGPAGTNNHK
jgi:hypothetical protein